MTDERPQLLADLQDQLPSISSPHWREKTEAAIRGLEEELAGAHAHTQERIAGESRNED